MGMSEEFYIKDWWEGSIERVPIFYVAIFLCLAGFLLYRYKSGLAQALGEALFISGVLAFFVDPILKKRLQKESARGIFHYLLGYDLEPEIRDRLKHLLFQTTLLRRRFRLRCVLVPTDDGMRLEMDCRFEVVNPTNEVRKYLHAVQCEVVERPQACRLNLVSEQGNYERTLPFVPRKSDPEVVEASGEEIEIYPATKGITYVFGSKFTLLYPREFFHMMHFNVPTIGVEIEVIAPDGYKVTASGTSEHAGNVWIYDRLFMPGEHVDFRWELQH